MEQPDPLKLTYYVFLELHSEMLWVFTSFYLNWRQKLTPKQPEEARNLYNLTMKMAEGVTGKPPRHSLPSAGNRASRSPRLEDRGY